MEGLKEKLEELVKQYQQVAQQALDSATLKTKLEGAIEFTQACIKEDEEKEEQKATKGKEKK